MVDQWIRHVLAALWPSVCVLCGGRGRAGLDLCQDCERDLPLNTPACSRCATPWVADPGADFVCGRCLRRPPFVHASFAAFRYEHPVNHMIQSFKYRRAAAQGRVLGLLLAGRLAQQVDVKPQALIPMPLGTKRYLERGFNQSFELARVVGAHLDLPVCGAAVVRRRETPEQAGLQRKERRRNVRDAFAVTRLPAGHVAILDDVVTTGSTADELAKALRRAGVRRVDLWAVAKTSGRIR